MQSTVNINTVVPSSPLPAKKAKYPTSADQNLIVREPKMEAREFSLNYGKFRAINNVTSRSCTSDRHHRPLRAAAITSCAPSTA